MKRAVTLATLAAAIVAGGLIWLWLASQPAAAPGAQDPVPHAPWQEVSWSQVEAPFGANVAPPVPIEMLVVAADGRLVGSGNAYLPGPNGEAVNVAATFVSVDGVSWRMAVIDDGLGQGEMSMLMGIAAGPAGLLAYGSVCCQTDVRTAWHSTDGLTWRRLELAGFDPETDYWMSVTGAPGGWIAVVSNGSRSRLIGSVDGATWRLITIDGEPTTVATGRGAFYAAGHDRTPDGGYDGALWTSSDGVTWTRIATAEPAFVNEDDVDLFDVVPFAGGLFARGITAPVEDRERCEEMAAVASVEPRPPVAFSCAWGNPMAWASTDGTSWTAVDVDMVDGSDFALDRAVAGGPGLVGLATDDMWRETVVWVSADGLDWAPLETLAPIAPDTNGPFAVRGRTIILAGTHYDPVTTEPEPVVWHGTVP